MTSTASGRARAIAARAASPGRRSPVPRASPPLPRSSRESSTRAAGLLRPEFAAVGGIAGTSDRTDPIRREGAGSGAELVVAATLNEYTAPALSPEMFWCVATELNLCAPCAARADVGGHDVTGDGRAGLRGGRLPRDLHPVAGLHGGDVGRSAGAPDGDRVRGVRSGAGPVRTCPRRPRTCRSGRSGGPGRSRRLPPT